MTPATADRRLVLFVKARRPLAKSTRLEPRLRTDGVVQRYRVKINPGFSVGGGGASLLHEAAKKISDFVSPLYETPRRMPSSARIEVRLSLPGRRDRILAATGIDIGDPQEVILDHRALHVRRDHPSVTLQDWEHLPMIVNDFDEAHEGWIAGDPKTKRLILVKRGNPRNYVYVSEVATGKLKGDREILHTFFKTSDAGLADYLKRNEDQRNRTTATRLLPGTSPGPALSSRNHVSPSAGTIPKPFGKSMLKCYPRANDFVVFGVDDVAAQVESVENGAVHLLVKGEPVWLDWSVLDIDRVSHRDGRALWIMKALGPGEHWITVRAPGHDKGTPVLIQDHPDGSASVIGGAGGKLNHLKLRGISPHSDLKQSLAEKAAERRKAMKEQTATDKASGVYEAKQGERAKLRDEVAQARRAFVQAVAETAGWTDHELDEEKHAGLSGEALAIARDDHDKAMFKRAKEVVNLNRKVLIEDADKRAMAGLGELPMQTDDPTTLSVADLEPMKEVSAAKLGFDPHYQERAGISKEEAKAEAGEQVPPSKPAEPAADASLKSKMAEELDAFRLENPETPPPNPKVLADAKKAADLIRIEKKLRLVEKKAKEANRKLDLATTVEPKATVLEVSDAEVEAAAAKQMEDDVRTAGARSFLAALDKQGGEPVMLQHIGAGAFNALNAFSTAVGGDSLIDRSVVDVLGIAGAAQVLARRVNADMAGDVDKVREAMEDWHLEHTAATEKDAIAKAAELAEVAASIDLPDATTGHDLAVAQEMNHKRRRAIAEAQKVLGQAHGEMSANAALVSALQGKPGASFEVAMGKLKPDAAVTQLRAIGLNPGDYKLDEAGGNLVATITGEGLDRLAKPIDREGMAAIRRNMDIMAGKEDEDGWLPGGFANRPDLALHADPGVAERLSQPFDFGNPDVEGALKDYIGGRMADGDAMVDILADAQSGDHFAKTHDPEAYRAALDAIAPIVGSDGKAKPIESLRAAWEAMAEDFTAGMGGKPSPIHKQSFEVDDKSVDALHRALAATPEGVAAFKPIGNLSAQERNGLRSWWHKNVAKEDAEAGAKREALDAHSANEPEKEEVDMFGETSINPAWSDWAQKKGEMAAEIKQSGLDWPRYVEMMGSPEKAMEAVQDLVRSQISKGFGDAYNTLNPKNPLKLGRTTIRNNLDHLDAVDPQARAARDAKEKSLIDSLRERSGGKYASGSVKEKMAAAKEDQAGYQQAQMGFFSTEEAPKDTALGADERHTLGQAAEQRIASMMGIVGQNFKPGQPTKLWQPSMNGKYAPQQRMIKMLEANKRVIGALGTGSGKSGIQLGGFTHLHGQGKVKRGLILAPSVVQGQFGGEALRYLEPGKYKWHANPGASREERLAAYRDPSTHFVVATHQSFRDDMIHLGATHAGVSEKVMADKLQKMTPEQRTAWAKDVMAKEGIDIGYMSVDESQYALNREGKENSRLANVVDAFAENTPYYMQASADIVKNDASEVFDTLRKADPKRYADRAAFMRKYGGDTVASKQALQRELARYVYASSITPDVAVDRKQINVDLNAEQRAGIKQVDKDVSEARVAAMDGRVAVDAMKRLSPAAFEGHPESEHEAIAASLQKNAGLLKNAAIKRIINVNPNGAKIDQAAKIAAERKGKPGVIFAHNLETVEHLRQRLEAEGHRVATITGGDSTQEKDKKRQAFNPEAGEAQADILIASDAAATGLNLQRGKWLLQMDTSDTAMTHAQRNGRIHRTGQEGNIELMDLVANHRSEQDARARLQRKYGLRELMSSPLEHMDDTGLAWHIKQKLAANQEAQ